MKLRAHGLESKFALGLAIFIASATLGIFGMSHNGEIVNAQGQSSSGEIADVVPSTPSLRVGEGDTVTLSVRLYGLQDPARPTPRLRSHLRFGLRPMAIFPPIATKGNTSVRYTAPSSPGTYTVTATAGSNCARNCTATFTITVRRSGEPGGPGGTDAVNPPGVIPTILTDSEGAQYEVFTPEGGGTFAGEGFSITAGIGIVPQRRNHRCPHGGRRFRFQRRDVASPLRAQRQPIQDIRRRCRSDDRFVLHPQRHRRSVYPRFGRTTFQHLEHRVGHKEQRRNINCIVIVRAR